MFSKVGSETTMSHLYFDKEEDHLNTGYSELDQGDRGSPWWERKKEGTIDGASVREQEIVPALVAIHHNTKRARKGPTEEIQSRSQQLYCQQYATKITKKMVQYIKWECDKSPICTKDGHGLLYKCSEEEEKNRRCRRFFTDDKNKFKLDDSIIKN